MPAWAPSGRGVTAWPRGPAWGLIIGFIGASLIVWPHGGLTLGSVGPQLAVVCACAAWALGTLYYRSVGVTSDPLMFNALQMLAGDRIVGRSEQNERISLVTDELRCQWLAFRSQPSRHDRGAFRCTFP